MKTYRSRGHDTGAVTKRSPHGTYLGSSEPRTGCTSCHTVSVNVSVGVGVGSGTTNPQVHVVTVVQ